MAIQIRRGTDAEWESNKSNIVAGEPAVAMDTERMFIGTGSGTYMEVANIEVLADAFDPSASYVIGDFVSYHGKVYKCNTDHSGAWNASHFDEVALADALDALGDNVYTKTEVDTALGLKADKSDTYTKTEVNTALDLKADKSDTYTKAEVDSSLALKADKSDTYTKAQVDSALNLKADAEDVYTKTEIDTELEDYAKVDGYYESMTVGNAEQLVTNLTDTESEPFTFRTSGGNLEIGDREELTVVGGSVAWNQHVPINLSWNQNRCTLTLSDGVYTATVNDVSYDFIGFYKANQNYLINGHKYFVYGMVKPSANLRYVQIGGKTLNNPTVNEWNTVAGIVTLSNSQFIVTLAYMSGTIQIGDTHQVKNLMVIDLTQMFGTTIADYIYSLEQATAGAGVAFFKKFFPKDYYPYNTGDMLHVQTSEFKTVGFNQFNLDALSADDFMVQLGDNFHAGLWGNVSFSVNNGVLTIDRKNTNYAVYFCIGKCYANVPMCVSFDCANGMVYDIDARPQPPTDAPDNTKRFYRKIYTTATNRIVHTFTPTQDGYVYIEFYRGTSTLVETFENLNYSYAWDGTRDGEYEPYTEHSYPLDDSLELRGIPKLDADNNLYFDGDTYEHDGTVTRRYGIVDLGTLTWTYNTSWATFGVFTRDLSEAKTFVADSKLICSDYSQSATNSSSNAETASLMSDRQIQIKQNAKQIYIRDSRYTDATAFKTAMSGVYLVYELDTPTTEEAEPYQTPQIVDNCGTEEFVVPTQSGVEIPVGHETVYPISLRDKLESAPNLPDGDGDYLLHMTNGVASYKQLVSEFPSAPTTDGTYVLKATVSNGTAILIWAAE